MLQTGYRIRDGEFISREELIETIKTLVGENIRPPASESEAVYLNTGDLAREVSSSVEDDFQLERGVLTDLTRTVTYDYIRDRMCDFIGQLLGIDQREEIDRYVTNLNSLMQGFIDKSIYDHDLVKRFEGEGVNLQATVLELARKANPNYAESMWLLAYMSNVLQYYTEYRHNTMMRFAGAIEVELPGEHWNSF